MLNSHIKTESKRIKENPTRRNRGAAYVEFALTLPFLLVFAMGLIEFGKGFNIYHNLTNACREGARQAVMTDTNQITISSANVIRNRVVNYMTSLGLQTSYYTGSGTQVSGTTNFTYGSYPAGAYLLINQGDTIPQKDASGNLIAGGTYYVVSRVELRYPYDFPVFSRVVNLMTPGTTTFNGTIYIKNYSIMEN